MQQHRLKCVGGPCDGKMIGVPDIRYPGDRIQVPMVKAVSKMPEPKDAHWSNDPTYDIFQPRIPRKPRAPVKPEPFLADLAEMQVEYAIYVIDEIRGSRNTASHEVALGMPRYMPYTVVRFLRWYDMTSEEAIQHQFAK